MKLDLSVLKGKLLEIAKFADEKSDNPNGVYLDSDAEISVFLDEACKAVKKGEITRDDVNAIFGFEKMPSAFSKPEESIRNTYLENLSRDEREQVTNKTTEITNNQFYEMAHNLDSMLIENEITGLGAILNRLPEYDLNKLAQRYLPMEEKYNKIENQVENWYKAPDEETLPAAEKHIFEENAEKILGMPYEEYAAKYSAELAEVAKIPPVIRGVSPISQIILHEQAVAKLSEAEREVYRQIASLNSVLATNFNAWENDIRYKANDKTSEMSMDIIENLDIVSSNEYADADSFEMPANWMVKKNFIQTVEEMAGLTSVDSIKSDSVQKTQSRKLLKDGKVIIEKTNPDGTIEYYNMSGVRIDG